MYSHDLTIARSSLSGGFYRWSAPLVVGRMAARDSVRCTLKEERPEAEALSTRSENADWPEDVHDASDPQLWDDPWHQPPPPSLVAITKVIDHDALLH